MMIVALALRNALRNTRRSILTALTVTLGVALLTLGMAWIQGVLGSALDGAAAQAGHVRVVDPEFARKEQLVPLAENLPDTAPLIAAAMTAGDGVRAYPRIAMPVTVTVGEDIGEHFGLATGAPLEWFDAVMELPTRIAEGRSLAADDEVVVGRTVADQAGVKVGDELVLLGQTQDGSMSPVKVTVVGIYETGNKTQDRLVCLTLEKMRWMADIPDGATELLVYGADRDDALALAAALRAAPAFGALEVKAWSERPPFDAMLGFIGSVRGFAAGTIVFITALGVLNTMLMSVLERTAEIGVLRALGLKKAQTVALFVVEAVGIAAVGGAVGTTIGGVLGWLWLERVGIDLGSAADKFPSAIPVNRTMYGDVDGPLLVQAFLLGLVVAVVGGALPALRAARIEPVEAMRTRR